MGYDSPVEKGWGPETEALIREVYPELREMAGCLMRRERAGHTLQRTALVHETFIRLFGVHPGGTTSVRSFLALAAHQMRNILIDYARRHRSLKAGGGYSRVPLFEVEDGRAQDADALLALNEALDRLGELDERALSVVELKFFGGFTTAEAAAVLQVSDGTVEEDWHFARSWLFGALTAQGSRLPA